MKFKNIFLITIIILAILSISAVSAADDLVNDEVVSAVNTHDTDLENCSTSLTSLVNIIDLTNKHFDVLGTSIDLTNTRCTNLVDISKKLKNCKG